MPQHIKYFKFNYIIITDRSSSTSSTFRYMRFTPTLIRNGQVGRPKVGITAGQISFLHNGGCMFTDISRILGISRRSLYNYRKKFNLRNPFINDDELKAVLQEILRLTPDAGEVYILGALRAKNYNVPRWRVRENLMLVDGVGRAIRKRKAIVRRIYRVKGSNYLWYVIVINS